MASILKILKKQLKQKLSAFFVVVGCLFIIGCTESNSPTSLDDVLARGSVNVGTLFGPNTYYIGSEGPAGFEYELAKKYAGAIGVELNIVASYNLEELLPKLASGEVDFLASGLLVTPNRLKQFKFSPSYSEVSQKLVFKQGNIRPRNIEQLTGKLVVTSHSSYAEKLIDIKAQYPELTWSETSELDNAELLEEVLAGNYDYTIVDSNTLAINRRYYPEISIGFTIEQPQPLAWAMSLEADDSILASLIEFFGDVHHNGTLLALNDKYYGHIEEFNYVDTRAFIAAVEDKLPDFQPWFEKYGAEIDWRLLAAISYQESHWNPRARSYTGVRGLMMLTLPTAKQMGVTSRLDPEQSIHGGAKYFKRLIDKMPDRIPNPDRIWFALASYNLGYGHLNDARIITQRQGGDPDRWVEVKTRLPLLKQRKHYKQTKFGYARGDEAVNYVENIRRYYDSLRGLMAKEDYASEPIAKQIDGGDEISEIE
ncbi:MAG: membrane-bound lytic murein transglycosylase MltF [Thalassotalea sp.]